MAADEPEDGAAGTHTHGQADPGSADAYTLSVEDAALQLSKSVETVRRYIRAGRLPAMRVQGLNNVEYRLRPEDVHDVHGQLTARSVTRSGTHTHDDRVTVPPGEQAHTQSTALMTVEVLMERLVTPLAAELTAARETIAVKDATIERQAEELGTLRERLRIHDEAARTAPAAAQLPRPWWAFWRSRAGD